MRKSRRRPKRSVLSFAVIGERIRQARQGQQRSLADIAAKAKISVATLSRIENDKQSVDLGLFLLIARVLGIAPSELLGEDGQKGGHGDPLAQRIATLGTAERAQLWRELTVERRAARGRARGARSRNIGQEVDELLAQIDFIREELESVRLRVKGTAPKVRASS